MGADRRRGKLQGRAWIGSARAISPTPMFPASSALSVPQGDTYGII